MELHLLEVNKEEWVGVTNFPYTVDNEEEVSMSVTNFLCTW